jgi:tetratricopeptide (TPR) repeat protein
VWFALALAALAVAVYANTLSYGLVYDDKLILTSPVTRAPLGFASLRALFTSDFYDTPKGNVEIFRPLTNASFLLNWIVNRWLTGDGASPFGFHLVTVALHALASALVFVLLERLSAPRAASLAAALIFAVHPIHSEAVANVSGRAESLAAALGIALLLAHRARRTFLAAIACFGALCSKESAIAFVPIALLTDALFPIEPRGAAKNARRWPLQAYAWIAATIAGWFALRAAGLRQPPSPICFIDNPLVRVTALERVLTAAKVQLLYLRLLVFPVGLSTDYSFDHVSVVKSAADPWVLGFAGVLALASIVAWRLRRTAPLVTLAVCGYALCFATTSNFLFPIGTLMAERLAYAPSIFACVIVAVAATSLGASTGRAPTAVAIGALGAAGFGLTWRQNRVWRDELTLVREQVRTAPDSAKAHFNLAFTLEDRGELAEAIREYEASTRIAPDYAWTWYWLGDAHERAREREAARAAFRRATEVDASLPDAHERLATVLLDLDRRNEAVAELARLVALDPQRALAGGLVRRAFVTSSPSERESAGAERDSARELARRGDGTGAAGRYQRAFASFALPEVELAQCAEELARTLQALGKVKLAAAWQAIARAFSEP